MQEQFCLTVLYMVLIMGLVLGVSLVLDWVIYHWMGEDYEQR